MANRYPIPTVKRKQVARTLKGSCIVLSVMALLCWCFAISLAIELLNLLKLFLAHALFEPVMSRVRIDVLLEDLFGQGFAGHGFHLGDKLEVEGLGHFVHAVPPRIVRGGHGGAMSRAPALVMP